jgi:tripartite ATP-independent transporter DctP family solute receptor
MTFTIAHPHPMTEDDDVHILASKFGEYLKEATGGKVTVDIVGDGVMGMDAELLEGIQLGTLDCVVTTGTSVADQNPAHQVLFMPFMFADYDEVHKFIDSDIMQGLCEAPKTTCNCKILAIGDGGFRQCLNNKLPINSAADFKGLKWRVMSAPLYISMFDLLGANPTPMPGGEVFTAMQQKTVDGCEFPISSIYSMQLYTVSKYVDLTNHMYSAWYLCFNNSKFESFSPELQAVMEECAQKALADQRNAVASTEADKIAEIEKSGTIVGHNPDVASMQEAVAPLYEQFYDIIGKDVFDKTLAFLADIRK